MPGRELPPSQQTLILLNLKLFCTETLMHKDPENIEYDSTLVIQKHIPLSFGSYLLEAVIPRLGMKRWVKTKRKESQEDMVWRTLGDSEFRQFLFHMGQGGTWRSRRLAAVCLSCVQGNETDVSFRSVLSNPDHQIRKESDEGLTIRINKYMHINSFSFFIHSLFLPSPTSMLHVGRGHFC